MRNQLNSSVLIDGFLYGIDGDTGPDAVLRCVDFQTGKIQWTEKGVGSGALMAANGMLIVLSEAGELLVAKASPEAFKPVSRAHVLGRTCWTVPVLSGGKIYCRNSTGDLVCLDVAGQVTAQRNR